MAETEKSSFARWLAASGQTLVDLHHATRIGYATLVAAKGGRPMRYATAKALSEATGGAVSIAELCEPALAEAPEQQAEPDAAA